MCTYVVTGKPKDIKMRVSVRGSWVGLLQSALQNKGKIRIKRHFIQ